MRHHAAAFGRAATAHETVDNELKHEGTSRQPEGEGGALVDEKVLAGGDLARI